MAKLNILAGPIIAAGESESAALDLGNDPVVGLITPEEWTPAVASVLVSTDGVAFFDLFNAIGQPVVFNVVAGTMIQVDAGALAAAQFLKLRSGTHDNPVPQEADRAFATIGAPGATQAAAEAAKRKPARKKSRRRR